MQVGRIIDRLIESTQILKAIAVTSGKSRTLRVVNSIEDKVMYEMTGLNLFFKISIFKDLSKQDSCYAEFAWSLPTKYTKTHVERFDRGCPKMKCNHFDVSVYNVRHDKMFRPMSSENSLSIT